MGVVCLGGPCHMQLANYDTNDLQAPGIEVRNQDFQPLGGITKISCGVSRGLGWMGAWLQVDEHAAGRQQ
jgi:hypothetical protein